MNQDYTSASKDWWQKHSDELKEWNWESFCKVWAAAADSVIPPAQYQTEEPVCITCAKSRPRNGIPGACRAQMAEITRCRAYEEM